MEDQICLRLQETQGDDPLENLDSPQTVKYPKDQFFNFPNKTSFNFNEYQNQDQFLSQMMKTRSPEQFAREFVYENNKINQKQQINTNFSIIHNKTQISQQQMQSVNRLCSPLYKKRAFGSEILNNSKIFTTYYENNNNNNQFMMQNQNQSLSPSSYTKMSEQFKKKYKKKEDCRAFHIHNNTDILLNQKCQPEKNNNIDPKFQKMHSEYMLLQSGQISQKKKQLVRKQFEIEMSGCTFKPQLNDSKNEALLSNKKSFLDQQGDIIQKYQNNKQNLENKIQEKENQTMQIKPKITKKSRQLANKKQEGILNNSVINRLYTSQDRTEKLTEKSLAINNQNNSCFFSPKITKMAQNIQRDQRVDVLLYEDAKKRIQERHQNIEQKQIFISQCAPIVTFNKSQNKKTVKATINRFHKEFTLILNESLRNKEEILVLNYNEFVEILSKLFFIDHNNISQSAKQCQMVWHQLNGKAKGFILQRNLLLFLYAVLNIYIEKDLIQKNDKYLKQTIQGENENNDNQNFDEESDKIAKSLKNDDEQDQQKEQFLQESQFSNKKSQISQQDSKSMKQKVQLNTTYLNTNRKNENSSRSYLTSEIPILVQNFKKIGYFDTYFNLHLTEQDVIDIHQKYYILYNNKLAQKKGNVIHRKISKSPENKLDKSLYSPSISTNSTKIALDKKQRLIQNIQDTQKGQDIDFHFISCFQKSQYEQNKENLRQQKEQEELSKCTFHPVIISFDLISENLVKRNNSINNFEDYDGKKINGSITKTLGAQRNLELYNMAKPINQRKDRAKLDIEYEKECDECTFSPNITFSNNKRNKDSLSNTQIKDIQKNIERIKQGQIQNQVSISLKRQGLTYNQKQFEQAEQNAINQIQQKKRKSPFKKPQVYKSNLKKNQKDYSRQIYNNQSDSHDLKQDSIRSDKEEQYNKNYNLNSNFSLDQTANSTKSSMNQNIINYNKSSPEEERIPLLFVDVNIEDGKTSRIIVYEGDKSDILAQKFAQEHGLDPSMKVKLKDLLDQQINSLLTKIEEEIASEVSSQKDQEEDI